MSVSVDKAELVKRAVAHPAAAMHFGNDDNDDDDDEDDSDERGNPDIARNFKVELGVASEQTADLEEAPGATEKCVRMALEQLPIPVIEASYLESPVVFDTNTAAQLESDTRALATAADRATDDTRNLKVEPGVASEHTTDFKEATNATEKCV